jgi:hypothetical protein
MNVWMRSCAVVTGVKIGFPCLREREDRGKGDFFEARNLASGSRFRNTCEEIKPCAAQKMQAPTFEFQHPGP